MPKSLPALLALLAFTPAAAAHGIECEASRSGPVVLLHCTYDPSGVVRGAQVQVVGPSEPQTVYQSGRTDPEGRFAFVPDGPGDWRVLVDDQMGHREEVRLTLDEEAGPVQSESTSIGHHHEVPAPADIPLLYRVLFGLSLIWGAAGMWYGYKARKTRSDPHAP